MASWADVLTIRSKECQRRKLKCMPVDGEDCARCIARGLSCVYRRTAETSNGAGNESAVSGSNASPSAQVLSLSNEVQTLRQDVSMLIQTVNTLTDKITNPTSQSSEPPSSSHAGPRIPLRRPSSTNAQHVPLVQSPAGSDDTDGGRQRHFIGPTRPAYAFHVGEGYLTRIGIPVYQTLPPSHSASPPGSPSPAYAPTPAEYWSRAEDSEIDRLITRWHDEVWCMYPYMDLDDSPKLRQVLRELQSQASGASTGQYKSPGYRGPGPRNNHDLDANIFQVVVASGLVLDSNGKNALATSIVDSVCACFFVNIYAQPVTLLRVQLLISLVRLPQAAGCCILPYSPVDYDHLLNQSRAFTTSTLARSCRLGA